MHGDPQNNTDPLADIRRAILDGNAEVLAVLRGTLLEGRATLDGEVCEIPSRADLPYLWDQIPPDQAAGVPNCTERDLLLAGYVNWAATKPWAWEGLRRLLEVLRERDEPIPRILQWWAYAAVIGNTKAPGTGRGRPEKADRNVRIMVAYRTLCKFGCSEAEAMAVVADVSCIAPETVRSAIRKVTNDRPFR